MRPPDTQVAVGPVFVGEAVNSELTVWSRTGSLVTAFDLNDSFAVPPGFSFTDPRLVFDVLSGRWFLSGLAFDHALDSNVYVAVSDSSDPTAGWSAYQLTADIGVVSDQPKIGVSTDKVVISWNDFDPVETFLGQETWVLQKSDLTNALTLHEARFPVDVSRNSIVPAVSTTASTSAFLVYDNTCSRADGFGFGSCTTGVPSLGRVAISGTPAGTDVVWHEDDPAMTETFAPPSAAQPSGATLETNDDRLLSAVVQNGTLWTTGNDACLVDGLVKACLRLVHASVDAGTALTVDGDLGVSGVDLAFPAITIDASNDPYVVATVSSASMFPSVVVLGQSASSTGFVGGVLRAGTGSYVCVPCGSPPFRWGDYSGAAVDPANPDDVWVAGEFATGTADNWATEIGEVTFAGPTVSTMSPRTGSANGGTVVTINGANFAAKPSVHFGAVAATKVSVQSPTQLQATAPAHSLGVVNVSVITPDGTSAATSATSFTYVPAPRPTTGYWMVDRTGRVYAFGSLTTFGNAATTAVTHVEPTPDSHGYWIVNAAGRVFPFGDAAAHGNASGLLSGELVSSMSATASGRGYWLFTSRGRVLPFGDAQFFGDMRAVHLTGPIVGSVATPTGHGYYMVGSDGGIFSFGDAHFHGSMGNQHLDKPVIDLVPTAAGTGYWLVASDGGVFAFNAPFRGSMGGTHLARPIVGMVRYGNGYLMVASDGGVFDFANLAFVGSLGGQPLPAPIVGIASSG